MRVVDLPQRTPPWHQWRNNGIAASEAPVIMGRSPYKTPWRLWAEKTALVLPQDLSGNPNVQRGIRLEPIARAAFEQTHNDLLLPLCAEAEHDPLFRASFDGINNTGEPVELKCPTPTVFEEVRTQRELSSAYQLYWVQVQHQILVADAPRGWLAFFHDAELLEFEIAHDGAFIQELEQTARRFWTLIETRQEPTKCPERDYFAPTGADQYRWLALAREYQDSYRDAQALEQLLKGHKQALAEAQSHLVAMMGAFAHADYGGIRLCRYWANGSVEYSRLVADRLGVLDEAELAQYRKPASERVRVSVVPAGASEMIAPPAIEHNSTAPALPGQQPRSYYF
jgi:putative phage-type endonuclease